VGTLKDSLGETEDAMNRARDAEGMDPDFESLDRDLDSARRDTEAAENALADRRPGEALEKGRNARGTLGDIMNGLSGSARAGKK
jgi:hypothetical protein